MKALILDDQPLTGKYLCSMIEEHCFEIQSLRFISSPLEALEHLTEHQYDLIFLDVEMPLLNGLEFLERADLPRHTQVIFTTGYRKYAVEAFQLNAVHYILKPVSQEDLIQAVRKASLALSQSLKSSPALPQNLTVFHGNEYHVVPIAKLICLEADGSYTRLELEDFSLIASKGLSHYTQLLEPYGFFRCHKSHLINLKKVSKFSKGKPGFVTMEHQKVIPVVASKGGELQKKLSLGGS